MSFFCNLVHWAATVKPIAEAFVLFTTPIVAGWTIYTYHRSVKLERAKWIKDLYEKFYESMGLKMVRDAIDSANHTQIDTMVANEDPAFTDYLNFFEFLGYLWESKQISKEELLGLFDYYLGDLKKNKKIVDYIETPKKGFEKLQQLLKLVP
jgi:hypothetical protein